MDPHGRIYSAPEDLIPAEDKARLDGYLKGREEAELLAERLAILSEVKAAAYEAKIREMEARGDNVGP